MALSYTTKSMGPVMALLALLSACQSGSPAPRTITIQQTWELQVGNQIGNYPISSGPQLYSSAYAGIRSTYHPGGTPYLRSLVPWR